MSDAQKTEAMILGVSRGEHCFDLVSQTVDTGDTLLMRLNYKVFNESTRQWVDDDKKKEWCLDLLHDIAPTASFDDPTPLYGATCTVWARDGWATLWEPREFVEFTPLIGGDTALLRGLARTQTFTTTPVTEWEGNRFNIGVMVDTPDGCRKYRISRFAALDSDGGEKIVSVKYRNKQIESFQKLLDPDNENAVTGETRDRLQNSVDDMLAVAREKLVGEFKSVLGLDLLALIESGGTLRVSVEVSTIPAGKYGFITARLAG